MIFILWQEGTAMLDVNIDESNFQEVIVTFWNRAKGFGFAETCGGEKVFLPFRSLRDVYVSCGDIVLCWRGWSRSVEPCEADVLLAEVADEPMSGHPHRGINRFVFAKDFLEAQNVLLWQKAQDIVFAGLDRLVAEKVQNAIRIQQEKELQIRLAAATVVGNLSEIVASVSREYLSQPKPASDIRQRAQRHSQTNRRPQPTRPEADIDWEKLHPKETKSDGKPRPLTNRQKKQARLAALEV